MADECAVTSIPDISVLGQFGPWAWLVCRILACGCSGVSRVRFRYRLLLWTDAMMRGGDVLFTNYFGKDLFCLCGLSCQYH